MKILHQAKQRQITPKQAAEQVGVSERWVRKLLGRRRQEGDRAVVHGLRGRSSNRKIPAAVREKAVRLVKREYADCGPTQAKGRAERFFGTAQDRLVKGLRKAGASTLEEAQNYLERVYLPLWNRRFTVPAANPTDAHRPLGPPHNWAAMGGPVESRVVGDDYTVRLQGLRYQIARDAVRPGLRRARV